MAARPESSAIPEQSRPSVESAVQTGQRIEGVVVHLLGEQPVVADVFGLPSPSDITLVCTNVRGTTGKRPVWADHVDSLFYFPWNQIRFLEIPPHADSIARRTVRTRAAAEPIEEAEEELDEEFLRRVRDA